MKTIYILTYSPTPDQIYGNLLALRTARTGFPTSKIIVSDNNSCEPARRIFKQLCTEHGYTYRQIEETVQHHDYLQNTIDQASGKIVICDPDVIFWENSEHLNDSENCVKGRLQPSMYVPLAAGMTLVTTRIHTSLLIIRDAQEYNRLLEPLKVRFGNPWAPRYAENLINKFQDTGSIVYEHLKQHHTPFTDYELYNFDHLTFGTHLIGSIDISDDIVSRPHRYARQGEYDKLWGLWAGQDVVWQNAHKQVPAMYL